MQSGWNNTLPGARTLPYNQPCYAVTLAPNQIAAATFGNRPVAATASTTATNDPIDPSFDESGVTINDGNDVAFDESGYDGHDPDAVDGNQPVLNQHVFLPLTQR